MATYLVTVKAPDGLNLGDLAAEVAEVLYHVPATVTARPLDPDAIREALRAPLDRRSPSLDSATAAVVAYLEV